MCARPMEGLFSPPFNPLLQEQNMKNVLKSAFVIAALTTSAGASATTWDIDTSHSSAQFSVRHLMISTLRGEFAKVSGTVNLDDKDVSKSSVDAAVDASTVSSRDAKRDEHLKSADFFDVAKYPELTFKSKSFKKAGKDKLKVVGDLTMHGVTKETTFDVALSGNDVKDPWGNMRKGAVATSKVNRKDFGLNWNAALEAGGVAVGDEVSITLDLSLVKKAAPAPAAVPVVNTKTN
jgi:polyisoprenoid-binding protein YceI